MPPLPLVFALVPFQKSPIEIYKFLIEVPFAKEKSPYPFKYEVSGLNATL